MCFWLPRYPEAITWSAPSLNGFLLVTYEVRSETKLSVSGSNHVKALFNEGNKAQIPYKTGVKGKGREEKRKKMTSVSKMSNIFLTYASRRQKVNKHAPNKVEVGQFLQVPFCKTSQK